MFIHAHSTEPGTEVSESVNCDYCYFYLWERLIHEQACCLLFPGTQLDYISQPPLQLRVVMSGERKLDKSYVQQFQAWPFIHKHLCSFPFYILAVDLGKPWMLQAEDVRTSTSLGP